jgi:hypothetical protein
MALKNVASDDLYSTPWLGEVMDVADPQFIGRIKVKVFGKFDQLATEDIPWAYPGNNMTGGAASGGGFFSVPKVGSIVSVKFDNGNLYHPEYFFVQKISDDVKAEIENSYENAHIIVYDTVTEGSLKIFFTEEKGLMFDYQETQINIKNDKSVIVQTASGDSKIEIKDDGNIVVTQAKDVTIECLNAKITASQSIHLDCSKPASIKVGSEVTDAIIKGTVFQAYFNTHTHIGNLGAPTSPPMIPSTPDHLSTISKVQ